MCTVTFIPAGQTIFLTSNRDEKNRRREALPPAVYEFNSGKILFPKDGDAGGTWIGIHESGNAVVFLNGGYRPHQPKPPYRKSRGLILLDLIDHSTPFNCFLAINLNNIEPFTAIIRDNGHFFECRWDGFRKTFGAIDSCVPHIWSSVTLYSDEVIAKRKGWFEQWISATPKPSPEEILHFHQFTGDGDAANDLLMNREGKLSTVSITLVQISPGSLSMDYFDLNSHESFSEQIQEQSSMAAKG